MLLNVFTVVRISFYSERRHAWHNQPDQPDLVLQVLKKMTKGLFNSCARVFLQRLSVPSECSEGIKFLFENEFYWKIKC